MTILSKEELAFIHRRSGAAEIEPKPQDGRRLENRVAALEGLVEKLSRDQPTRITDLAQQVQALTERVEGMADMIGDLVGFNVELTERIDALPTPPQPADDGGWRKKGTPTLYRCPQCEDVMTFYTFPDTQEYHTCQCEHCKEWISFGSVMGQPELTPPQTAAPRIDPEDVYKVLRKHIGGDEYARIISQDVSDFLNGYTND